MGQMEGGLYIPIKPRDLPSFSMADEEEARTGSWEFQIKDSHNAAQLQLKQDGGLLKPNACCTSIVFLLPDDVTTKQNFTPK